MRLVLPLLLSAASVLAACGNASTSEPARVAGASVYRIAACGNAQSRLTMDLHVTAENSGNTLVAHGVTIKGTLEGKTVDLYRDLVRVGFNLDVEPGSDTYVSYEYFRFVAQEGGAQAEDFDLKFLDGGVAPISGSMTAALRTNGVTGQFDCSLSNVDGVLKKLKVTPY